jgi:alcohol dehydrogenase
VFDAGVEKAGLTKGVEKSLKEAGIDYVVFKDVAPDPTDVSIEAGGKVAREAKVDVVIGIGGGSCLDTAKGVNVLMANPSPLSDYFLGGKPTAPGLPLFLIPTTAGTGSECTLSCIVTDTKGKRKTTIRSKNCNIATLAIVDPGLSVGLPPHLTSITGADAFCHSAESMTVKITNGVSDALAKESIRNLSNYLPTAIATGTDVVAREKVATAAMMSGMAFANTLCHLGHCFGHSIGATLHLPHGLCVGVSIAQAIYFVTDAIPDKVKELGLAMGLDMSRANTAEDIANTVGNGIQEFKKKIKLPALKDQPGVDKEKVISAYPLVTKDGCYPFSPKTLTEQQVKEYLGKIYDNVL